MEDIKLLYVDLFCGAGGTSTGVETATLNGRKCAKVVACVNHDAHAIMSHMANHPEAHHFTEDIRTVAMEPIVEIVENARREHPGARLVLWASLECTNFSKAKGGQPRDADSRTLANHLFRYIEALKPDYIQIENVVEFMAWGEIDENGKPISKLNGTDYIRWCNRVQSYGCTFSWRELNAADFGAYTSRKRFFGQFVRHGLAGAFPEPTHCKNGCDDIGMFHIHLERWRAVRDVLDFDDEGESIFTRKKPLVEKTLSRIYQGLVKFVANGKDESMLVKYNSVNGSTGKYSPPSLDDPCPVVATQNRLAVAKCHFLSKQFSGDPASKNIGVDGPAGALTTIDHHALITYYGTGHMVSVDDPSPTLTTHDRVAKMNIRFLANEFSGGGQIGSIDSVCPAILTKPKQQLVSAFLMNPQYTSAGGSIDSPCFTLIARMDKMPPYLVQTKQGIGIEVYESDSPMTRKIKGFMAAYGIIDIKMRMLKVSELKAIMGFPNDYVLVGTISEQKKYIGNAVEVHMSRALCEALAQISEGAA